MKRVKAFLSLALLGIGLVSCTVDPASLEPKGVDFATYSSNPYITSSGTTYINKDDGGNYSIYRLSPRGVIFTETRFGKMLFEENPTYTYLLDSATNFHYIEKRGGYVMNNVYIPPSETRMEGLFFTNENGVRCFNLVNKNIVFVAE